MTNPSIIKATPTKVTVLKPGPEPVNAREPEAAVTARLGVDVVDEPELVAIAAASEVEVVEY